MLKTWKMRKILNNYVNINGYNVYSRKREVVYARACCFFQFKKLGLNLREIGEVFDKSGRKGFLDHATVINGLKIYDDLYLNGYDDFKQINKKITNEVKELSNEEDYSFSFKPMMEVQSLINLENCLFI